MTFLYCHFIFINLLELTSYNIIKKEQSGNCGFSSDDEHELEIVSGDQIDEDEIFDL